MWHNIDLAMPFKNYIFFSLKNILTLAEQDSCPNNTLKKSDECLRYG